MSPDTQVGPITTPPQYKKVLDYTEMPRGEGAKAALGGAKAAEFAKVLRAADDIHRRQNSMRIAQEEVFGPVLSVIPFEDDEGRYRNRQRVVAMVLRGASDARHQARVTMANRLQAGTVWVKPIAR